MARLAYSLNNFPRHARPHLDSKHRLVEDDDDNSVLDDNILDCTSPEMSPSGHVQRKESFADTASTFSPPRDGTWSDFSFNNDSSSVQPSNSSHLFVDQGGIPFVRADVSHPPSYGNPPSTWHPTGSQGSCTPTTAYEGFAPGYDIKATQATYSNDAVVSAHPNMYGGLPMRSTFQSSAALSTSPQSGQDWMSTSSSDHIELQSMSKHARIESPTYHSNPPLLRRDGIRKKNARFEIPAERTLRTIDHLINQTSDEQEIKELKQQKRLLRNRQAALDSRQRKKQHTERLEEEKKHTSTIINELEEALGEMKLREADWARERESLISVHQQLQHYVDDINMEKEELVRCHTIETGELRKKNAFLADQAQKLEAISMSAVPSSTGYSADFSDFDHLTMESSAWDNFSMVNDFSMDAEPRQETSLVVLPKKEKLPVKDDDKTATSGLLLMLLLCGAWVASNNTASTPAVIPRMSDDVRVASAAVLENIYRDAGLQPLQVSGSNRNHAEREKPSSSSNSVKTTLSAAEIASLSNSPLASLHHQLITPSEEQRRDQAFSLTANQYNGITSGDFFDEPKPSGRPYRKNIGEALADMRNDKHGSAAEIYTRSLMWDEVPANVVRDFARMVAECNSGAARQENGEPIS